MRKLLLHIGVPKSGTTFLQTRTWNNRQLLRERGLLYPGSERIDHFHLTRVVRGVAEPGSPSLAIHEKLLEEIHAWDRDVLLTHEFFCLADTEQALRFLRRLQADDVTVVITARDLVRQFPAVWQERLKMGTLTSYSEYMQRAASKRARGGPWSWESQDLVQIVDRWSEALRRHGAPAPTIVTVPPRGSGSDVLWRRWCEALGIDDTDFVPDRARANASLGAPQAALIQHVLPHLEPPFDELNERHRWLRGYLAHDVLVPQGGPRIGVAPEHRAALLDHSRDSVEQLGRRDLRVVGDLDDLVPSDEPSPHDRTPDDVDPSEVVDVAARALARAVHDVRRLELARREAVAAAVPPAPANRVRRAAAALRDRLSRRGS